MYWSALQNTESSTNSSQCAEQRVLLATDWIDTSIVQTAASMRQLALASVSTAAQVIRPGLRRCLRFAQEGYPSPPSLVKLHRLHLAAHFIRVNNIGVLQVVGCGRSKQLATESFPMASRLHFDLQESSKAHSIEGKTNFRPPLLTRESRRGFGACTYAVSAVKQQSTTFGSCATRKRAREKPSHLLRRAQLHPMTAYG